MTTVSRHRRFFWRIVPVLFVTAVLATPIGLAVSAVVDGQSINTSLATVSVTATAAFGIAAALIIPAILLWIVVFNWITPNMLTPAMLPSMPQLPPPAIWRRAAWATMVTTLVGALALFVFIDVLVGNPDSLVWPLLHWTLVPVVLGCTLRTWLAFRGLKPEDIGRRE